MRVALSEREACGPGVCGLNFAVGYSRTGWD